MRALTVRQPWAWAIIHGGKNVENRTQAWSYRGPLAIHAGLGQDNVGMTSPLVSEALRAAGFLGAAFRFGAILGVVDLVDVHDSIACVGDDGAMCSAWAEPTKFAVGPGVVHLEVVNPRPLTIPIPCKGRLGLWTPPADVLDKLQEVAH